MRPPGSTKAAPAGDRAAFESFEPSATRPSDSNTEAPEHNGERRRFLVWALMVGAVRPEAVTERIVAEIEEGGASVTADCPRGIASHTLDSSCATTP